MGTLNDLVGMIGGAILGVELIVLVLLLVAINGGIAFGLWWVLKKMGWVHEKVEWALKLEARIVDKSTNVVAAPVIIGTSVWRGLKAGLYRASHWPKQPREISSLPTAPALSATTKEKSSQAA